MKQHGTMEGYKNIEDILVNISGAEDDGETTLSFYVSKIKHDTKTDKRWFAEPRQETICEVKGMMQEIVSKAMNHPFQGIMPTQE